MSIYWPVALAMGVGTFLLRFSFILIMDKMTFPDAVTRMLRFIPASVLTALIVPAVLLGRNGEAAFAGWERLLAALVAVVVAWKTKNTFVTIASGMGVLWLLQAVM
ncbi:MULTISPECIES: AzlD domain-containing protein [unclassified Pseudodesulfovibrio]|uniref:AzlD domain-containing protein n=1 Tax=unclassified Pseudodesulfovibrio TaxID=2661612 RepID=UPI001F4F581C|nr:MULTISPECIES: AzlD domain-containing protein [unclassified Pseudodesulfovibrio]MCJ2165662.1 AzlD domain-containing protein [Pseudodesulfovibrio sp. S3-i]